jgi:hypothetical protein
MTKLFEIKNLVAIRLGIDRHNANCPIPAEAVLMNPIDCQLMAHSRLWGVPVIPDPSVPTKRFRLKCEGSSENIEEELEIYLGDF